MKSFLFRHLPRMRGYTIVELAAVIAVIAILAGASYFAIGAWRDRIADTEVRNDMINVTTAMKNARNWGDGYPVYPSGTTYDGTNSTKSVYIQSPNVTLTYDHGDVSNFCVDGQSKARTNVYYFVDTSTGSAEPKKGTCAGGEDQGPVVVKNIKVNDTGSNGSSLYSFSTTADLGKIIMSDGGFDLLYSSDGGSSWTNLYDTGPISNELWSNYDAQYGKYGVSHAKISPNGGTIWLVKTFNMNLPGGADISYCLGKLVPSGALWQFAATQPCTATRIQRGGYESIGLSSNGSIIGASESYQIEDEYGSMIGDADLRLSNNNGDTFSQENVCACGGGNFGAFVMSSNGQVMVGKHSNKIVITSDFGSTWNQISDPSTVGAWGNGALAISGDGGTIAYSSPDQSTADNMYISRDQGASWQTYMKNSGIFWRNISVSSNGQRMVAIGGPQSGDFATQDRAIYTSNNYGATWAKLDQLGPKQWEGIAVSTDGLTAKAVAGESGTAKLYSWTF